MNLRKLLLGMAGLLCLAVTVQPANGQIYTFFKNTMKNEPYRAIPDGQKTVLTVGSFVDPATRFADPNDGYYYANGQFGIPIGFDFEFEGIRYQRINVNVNGFVSFGTPSLLGANLSNRLFTKDAPNAVIAPYWGDHYYRDGRNGFVASEISFARSTITVNNIDIDVLTIEWKNLNINYFADPNDPTNPLSPNAEPQPSSVGTFQLKIYESVAQGDPVVSPQGNIEFHYSTVGNSQIPGFVNTSGAGVGIESHPPGAQGRTTFMNGLFIEDDSQFDGRTDEDGERDSVIRSTRRTSTWAPSRANNNVICFIATPEAGIDGWGDGDANLSQLRGRKHFGRPQNEFVTFSDVITIMRSVALNLPLDSLLLRAAYHGDVNHNGRYYYSFLDPNFPNGKRVNIKTRSENVFSDLPADNTFSQLYFDVTSYDAALIVNYMAGKVPALPWLLDTTVSYGKAGALREYSEGINTPGVVRLSENTFRVPVHFKGDLNGAVGLDFGVNGRVLDVSKVTNDDIEIHTQNGENKVVVAASGSIGNNTPLVYLTVQTDENVIRFSDINLNDVNKGSLEIPVGAIESASVLSFPNPFTERTEVTVNVPADGVYSLAIYDMFGNKIAQLANGELNKGTQSFTWDGTNGQGTLQAAGMYMYRFEGNGISHSGSISIVR